MCSSTSTSLAPLAIAAVVASLTGCTNTESRETFDEKAEWSVLQAVEFKNRSTPLAAPVLQTEGEHQVLGLRATNGQNVWILLKPSAPPYYKQMPSEPYEIEEALLRRLINERRVSYTVESVLSSRVSKP